MSMLRRLVSILGLRAPAAVFVIAVILCAAPESSISQTEAVWSDVERVVAIGDVHGAYRELIGVLKAAGIVDDELNWSAGRTHFVSVGDLLDRGPDSKAVVELLMRLQREAEIAGGRVHVLLGNHEVMNLIGDLRYVSADEYADYDSDAARAARASALQDFLARNELQEPTVAAQGDFDSRYPPGYFGHRAAFAPSGYIGAWLLSRPTIIVINGTAFVHGGLPPLVATTTLDALNSTIRGHVAEILDIRRGLSADGYLSAYDMSRDYESARELLERTPSQDSALPSDAQASLQRFVELHDSQELGIEGPLWYRGAVTCKPVLEDAILTASLARLGAERVVVGHTPTNDARAHAWYGGRLIALDTGMLTSYYHGRATALVLEGDEPKALYADSGDSLPLRTGRRELAYGMTMQEAVMALTTAEVALPQGSDEALVTLNVDGREIHARMLEDEQGDRELTAFELSQLLGFDIVPPTVERIVDAQPVALQLVYPDGITEQQRLEQQRDFGGWCDVQSQIQLMYVFDLLVANSARDATNLAYRDDVSDIYLTDFTAAFGSSQSLPSGVRDGAVAIQPGVVAALRTLTAESLAEQLGERLSTRERRGLIGRRDELLERFAGSADRR